MVNFQRRSEARQNAKSGNLLSWSGHDAAQLTVKVGLCAVSHEIERLDQNRHSAVHFMGSLDRRVRSLRVFPASAAALNLYCMEGGEDR
jgi:hypothetical protein